MWVCTIGTDEAKGSDYKEILLTHGQGFTASLGKKPTSFVDRILPWNHREIIALCTSGGLRVHNSATISWQYRAEKFTALVNYCWNNGWQKEGGEFCIPPQCPDLWTLGRTSPCKQGLSGGCSVVIFSWLVNTLGADDARFALCND